MKVDIEVKVGNRVIKGTADSDKAGKVVLNAAEKIEAFIKDTFKVETFTKDTKDTQ